MKILCGELQVIAINLHNLGLLSREAQFWLMAAEMNQESYWLAETLGNCTREFNSEIGKNALCHLSSLNKCSTSDMLIAHFDELDSILSDECGAYHIVWLDNYNWACSCYLAEAMIAHDVSLLSTNELKLLKICQEICSSIIIVD